MRLKNFLELRTFHVSNFFYQKLNKKRTVTMLVPDDRIDRRVLLQAKSLTQAGWKVVIIASTVKKGEEFSEDFLFPEVIIDRIDTSYVIQDTQKIKNKLKNFTPLGQDWKTVYWYHYHFLIKALKYPADIVVAHDLPVLAAATIVANVHKAWLVYDAHELYPEQYHFSHERRELYRQAEKKLISSPDLLITVNRSISSVISHRYQVPPPAVILNAPDFSADLLPIRPKNLLRNSLNIDSFSKVLLFQGSISLNRNLENLVEAMSIIKCKDVVLVVMGPDGGKLQELINLAKDLDLFNLKVFFHRAVSQKQLLDYTASADAGIIPYPHIDLNSKLCSPNKLFEYLVASLPILANESPELIRFVSNQKAGITHPMNNPIEIAEGIQKIFSLDLSHVRTNMEKICSNFIWEIQGKKLVNLYASILR